MRLRNKAAQSPRNPWANGHDKEPLLISVLGPVIDLRRALPDVDLPVLFKDFDKALSAQVAELVAAPGFVAGLQPVPGAVDALRAIRAEHLEPHLHLPGGTVWRHRAGEVAEWVDAHLGPEWQELLVVAHHRAQVRARRLLTSYAEPRDWADPEWDVVVFDQPDNTGLGGVRMYGWADTEGLVGNWRDRIPWKNGVWEIEDSSHFGVWVTDRGRGKFRLDVYLEMYDVSNSYTAEVTDDYWDLGQAAARPRRAAEHLLGRSREWVYNDTEGFVGDIQSHRAFMWGGRPW